MPREQTPMRNHPYQRVDDMFRSGCAGRRKETPRRPVYGRNGVAAGTVAIKRPGDPAQEEAQFRLRRPVRKVVGMGEEKAVAIR